MARSSWPARLHMYVPGRAEVPVDVSIRLVARSAASEGDSSIEVPAASSQDVDLPGSAGRVHVELQGCGGGDGVAKFRLTCQGRMAQGWVLYEAALCFRTDMAGWSLVLPSGWGRELPQIPQDLKYSGNYPGWSALAQVMILQAAEGGIWIGLADPAMELKELRAHCNAQGRQVVLEVTRVPMLRDGLWGVEGACEVVAAVYAGSWDAAAKAYRRLQETVRPTLKSPRPLHPLLEADPIWLTQNCFCYPPHGVEQTIQAAGLLASPVLVHLYNWQDAPFDTHYPDWVGIRPAAVQQVRALWGAGLACTPYINCRLWDQTTESWPAMGNAACVLDWRGQQEIERYPATTPAPFGVMCPSQQEYRDKVIDVARRLLDAGLNFPGLYLDQLGAAFGRRCYADSHGHAPGGALSWNTGQRDVVRQIREVCAEHLEQEPILTTENASEPLVDLLDGFLYFCGRPYEATGRPVPLWQAIYSDHGCGFADNFGNKLGLEDGKPPLHMLERIARQAIFGCNLGWIAPQLTMGEYAAVGQLMRNARSARLGMLELMRHGWPVPRTMDTTGERTGVLLATWRDDAEAVALAVNPRHERTELIWPDGARGTLKPYAAQSRRIE